MTFEVGGVTVSLHNCAALYSHMKTAVVIISHLNVTYRYKEQTLLPRCLVQRICFKHPSPTRTHICFKAIDVFSGYVPE